MATYVSNQVFYSPLSGNIYFVKRAKVIDAKTGSFQVVGKKIDVTESVEKLISDAIEIVLADPKKYKRMQRARQLREGTAVKVSPKKKKTRKKVKA
jgi:hypothetical protein